MSEKKGTPGDIYNMRTQHVSVPCGLQNIVQKMVTVVSTWKFKNNKKKKTVVAYPYALSNVIHSNIQYPKTVETRLMQSEHIFKQYEAIKERGSSQAHR